MPDDAAEKIAEGVVGAIASRPNLADVDPDDTVTVKVNWFDHPRKDDTAGFTIGAVFGVEHGGWYEYLEEHVEPVLDHRKLGEGQTEIGSVTFNGDGEVVGHTVKRGYLKPSELVEDDDA